MTVDGTTMWIVMMFDVLCSVLRKRKEIRSRPRISRRLLERES
jgi:hypothetical protein